MVNDPVMLYAGRSFSSTANPQRRRTYPGKGRNEASSNFFEAGDTRATIIWVFIMILCSFIISLYPCNVVACFIVWTLMLSNIIFLYALGLTSLSNSVMIFLLLILNSKIPTFYVFSSIFFNVLLHLFLTVSSL